MGFELFDAEVYDFVSRRGDVLAVAASLYEKQQRRESMMKAIGPAILAMTALCFAGKLAAAIAAAVPTGETQKIESLISTVQNLKEALFIRNGTEYDCKAAANHIRAKWKWKRDEIKTARDFIRVAASTSSQSGKPYLIRFTDGREVKSADFLSAELDKLERPPSSQPSP